MNLLGTKNKIDIQLDKKLFFYGEPITGTLLLSVHDKITLYTLEIFVFGKEKVWLSIGIGDDNHHDKQVKNFFEKVVYLVGETDGKKKPPKTVIPPGEYEYKFSCTVDPESTQPPSIEIGKTGIYYGCWYVFTTFNLN